MSTLTLTAPDGHTLGAYRADPKGVARGAIVVIQEIFGVNSHIRSICDRLAEAGYVAIAPALFDRTERDFECGYSPDEITHARSFIANADWDAFVRDSEAARAPPWRISAMLALSAFAWAAPSPFWQRPAWRCLPPRPVFMVGASTLMRMKNRAARHSCIMEPRIQVFRWTMWNGFAPSVRIVKSMCMTVPVTGFTAISAPVLTLKRLSWHGAGPWTCLRHMSAKRGPVAPSVIYDNRDPKIELSWS